MARAARRTLASTFGTQDLGALALSIAVAFSAAAIGGLTTDTSIYAWMPRPSWAPPGWVFAPVWALLYLLMAVAAFLVWRARGGWSRALALYGVQLALNAAWTPIFFGLREPWIAFAEIVLLWLAVAATIIAFARVQKSAALLMAPYLAWMTFAAALNLRIAQLA